MTTDSSLDRAATPIRILCVDDHALVREGIQLILERYSDMTIVGAAATGVEAIAQFQATRPDVTLMDLQLPIKSGLDAIRAIRSIDPDADVIVLTMYQGDADIRRAMQAGAAAYLLKDMLSDDLASTIRDVYHGHGSMSPRVQSHLDEHAGEPLLTPREVEVMELISRGMRNKEIARALDISEETAQVHVKNIFAKLKVNDRTAAMRQAIDRGIIHL